MGIFPTTLPQASSIATPSFQPVQSPLVELLHPQADQHSYQIRCHLQITEGALDPLIQIVDKHVK